jgi:nitrogen regulatory protein PII
MKRVVAIIQPFKLEEVEEAVIKVGVSGLNVTRSWDSATRKGIPRFIAAPNIR